MVRQEKKYVLDANLFILGFREEGAYVDLQRFHALFAPFEYLSVIVERELRSGTQSLKDRRRLEKDLLLPYHRRNRILVPSAKAWEESGNVLAELARIEGLQISKVSKSFDNDILLALSCREAGMTLVTRNVRDFARIAAIAPFEFVEPWPFPSS